jgi:hypothetical protein
MIHRQFIPVYSVALVILPTAIVLNEFVQPVALPREHREERFVDVFGTVSGWGVYSDEGGRTSDELRFVATRILSNDRCARAFPGVIRNEHICLEGLQRVGACSGT